MEFDTNWRIESKDILFILTTGYLKSISSHIEWLLGWLYGLILNNYPVTYSFHGVFFELRYQNVTWNLTQNWSIESRDILFKSYHRLYQEYFKSYRIAFRVALWLDFWTIIKLLIILSAFFSLRYDNVTWNLIQNGGVNQKISHSNLPQVISRVYQVI